TQALNKGPGGAQTRPGPEHRLAKAGKQTMQANNSSRNGPRKVFNSARHAARWLERGIYPVPLDAGTKVPKGEKHGSAKGANGWTKLRVTEDTIAKYFKEGDNVGGLWGEPSGWAV